MAGALTSSIPIYTICDRVIAHLRPVLRAHITRPVVVSLMMSQYRVVLIRLLLVFSSV